MPKVNGDEFITTIRRGHYNQYTPIIIVSSSKENLKQIMTSNDHIYSLSNPFNLNSLRQALNNSPVVSKQINS
jgi:CheY-like chemotaxis protein